MPNHQPGCFSCPTRCRTLSTVILVITACSLVPAAHGQQRHLSPTVMVNGFKDLEGAVQGSNLPVCQYTVQRSRAISSSISFALTVFPMAADKEDLDSWTYKDAQGNNVPANPTTIARWQSGLQQCFKFAVDQGFTDMHVLGHFDPLHPVLLRPTTWRNLINIGPKTRSANDGLSYNDVMIVPVTVALAAVASPKVNLWFSVSGEMGLSNFFNPREWIAVLEQTRSQLKQKPWKSVRVATALNWQMVCGCVAAANPMAGTFDPVRYNSSYAAEFDRVKQHALPLAPAFKGLGGVLRYGVLPAPDLATVAKYPMSGNWPHNGYNKEVDPWHRPDFAAYRRKFYQATIDLLQRGRGDTFKIDRIYVWSVGRFDVFGVHPISSSSAGTFADANITAMAKKQNGLS